MLIVHLVPLNVERKVTVFVFAEALALHVVKRRQFAILLPVFSCDTSLGSAPSGLGPALVKARIASAPYRR